MDKTEKTETGMQKSILSVIVLLGCLMLLMYAAPVLHEKLRAWSQQEKSKELEPGDHVERVAQPQVPENLVAWLPLVTERLPQLSDGIPKYQLMHMRLNEDKSQLLLDLREGEEGRPFDLILQRDQFGRYISASPDIPMKLYPPEE